MFSFFYEKKGKRERKKIFQCHIQEKLWIVKIPKSTQLKIFGFWEWTPSMGRKVGIPRGILPRVLTELTNWKSR